MPITPDFIHAEIANQTYEISLHADDERIADGLTILQVEYALLDCTVLEHYPGDPRGESCLVLGFIAPGQPLHVICGKNPADHMVLITVYIPSMPKWRDPYTRNR